jgi:hypothetical protein
VGSDPATHIAGPLVFCWKFRCGCDGPEVDMFVCFWGDTIDRVELYLVSLAVECHLLAGRTCKGKHVFLLHGMCKSFVSVACIGIPQ